jgi:hypothetical protein
MAELLHRDDERLTLGPSVLSSIASVALMHIEQVDMMRLPKRNSIDL